MMLPLLWAKCVSPPEIPLVKSCLQGGRMGGGAFGRGSGLEVAPPE